MYPDVCGDSRSGEGSSPFHWLQQAVSLSRMGEAYHLSLFFFSAAGTEAAFFFGSLRNCVVRDWEIAVT